MPSASHPRLHRCRKVCLGAGSTMCRRPKACFLSQHDPGSQVCGVTSSQGIAAHVQQLHMKSASLARACPVTCDVPLQKAAVGICEAEPQCSQIPADLHRPRQRSKLCQHPADRSVASGRGSQQRCAIVCFPCHACFGIPQQSVVQPA